MDDLEEVRLKEVDELTDDEKNLLKEHQDDLSDDEKEAFKSIIETKEEEKEEEKEDEPFKSFKTEEEFNKFIEEERGKVEPEDKEEEGEDEEPVDFFPKDYKPKDWNQFAKDLLPKLQPHMRQEFTKYSDEQKKQIAEINAQFDQEIEQLRVIDSSIPAAGTPERKEFDRELAQVALKNKNVRTMTEAYSIYKKEKGDKGDDDKDVSDEQKDLAKKVGGGSKSGGKKKEREYKELSQMSEEDAWEAALRDLEGS